MFLCPEAPTPKLCTGRNCQHGKVAFLTSEVFPYNQLMLCPGLYFENWACKTSASRESSSTSSESMFRVDFYRKTVIENFGFATGYEGHGNSN